MRRGLQVLQATSNNPGIGEAWRGVRGIGHETLKVWHAGVGTCGTCGGSTMGSHVCFTAC